MNLDLCDLSHKCCIVFVGTRDSFENCGRTGPSCQSCGVFEFAKFSLKGGTRIGLI